VDILPGPRAPQSSPPVRSFGASGQHRERQPRLRASRSAELSRGNQPPPRADAGCGNMPDENKPKSLRKTNPEILQSRFVDADLKSRNVLI
jgi:hypothetical protein